MRLRTLPLAASSILLGSFLAAQSDSFEWSVFLLALLSAFSLQILSNLANDYGDYIHGADHGGRIGPDRAVQSGAISPESMKRAVSIFSWMSLCLVSTLSVNGTWGQPWWLCAVFILLGVVCIQAAIHYTSGPSPYGYLGLGDPSVFIFFGLCGVLGTYYLHTATLHVAMLLPAATMGFFCTGVLNINNLRDIDSDAQAGKRTLVVIMGPKAGRLYHLILILGGWICAVLYAWFYSIPGAPHARFLFLVAAPFMACDALIIARSKDGAALDPFLKKLAIGTFCFSIMFGSCLLFR
jgi:1,4-dihydroxy-2-naphthoate octaprenyltransferase